MLLRRCEMSHLHLLGSFPTTPRTMQDEVLIDCDSSQRIEQQQRRVQKRRVWETFQTACTALQHNKVLQWIVPRRNLARREQSAVRRRKIRLDKVRYRAMYVWAANMDCVLTRVVILNADDPLSAPQDRSSRPPSARPPSSHDRFGMSLICTAELKHRLIDVVWSSCCLL